ncbi:polysaccharide biosynthesis protein, partial [Vibrio anguillarum]|nr:polysaccharide biosynthesis protein [Vibrio anguillarum]
MARLNFIWNLSRVNKRIISVIIDLLFIVFSFYAAYWVRIGEIALIKSPTVPYLLGCVAIITILSFTRLGLYRAVLRCLTFPALAV